jgi:hypothetical protein
MIFKNLIIYYLIIGFNQTPFQYWSPYYKDKRISISYTSKVCQDNQNGFAFEYYVIQVQNLTDQTLVVNFNKSPEENSKEEDLTAFVLKPKEIKTGSCDYNPEKLRIFKEDRRPNKTRKAAPFVLSKINSIEVN